MKLDITSYRHYIVPIFTRKFNEFDKDINKFMKYLVMFAGSPGAPPAAAVYMIANEIAGPNEELQKCADRLVEFYKYEEIIT